MFWIDGLGTWFGHSILVFEMCSQSFAGLVFEMCSGSMDLVVTSRLCFSMHHMFGDVDLGIVFEILRRHIFSWHGTLVMEMIFWVSWGFSRLMGLNGQGIMRLDGSILSMIGWVDVGLYGALSRCVR